MPLVREFRGRPVKRTRRRGKHIVVVFKSSVPGLPGDRLVVPLAEFLRKRTAYFERRPDAPRQPAS